MPGSKSEIEAHLKSILKYAREKHLKISIAGARHSMGGHTIYPGGIALNMLPYKQVRNEGTYYLPCRLHIDKEKMRRFYPAADSFFLLKRKYDPEELFSNQFYEHYKK